jgi:hypothetical protein
MGLLDDAIREHLDLKRRRGGDPAEIERMEREALGPVRRESSAFAGATAVADDPRALQGTHADAVGGELHGHDEHAPEPESRGALGYDEPHEHEKPAQEPRRRRFLRRPGADESEREDTRRGAANRPDPPRREPPHLTLEGELHPDDEPAAAGAQGPAAPAAPPEEQATRVHQVEPAEHDDALEHDEPGAHHELGAHDAPGEHDTPGAHEAPGAHDGVGAQHDEVGANDDAHEAHPAAPGGGHESGEEPEPQEHADEPDPLEETPEFLQDAPEHDRLWFEQRPPRDFDFDG